MQENLSVPLSREALIGRIETLVAEDGQNTAALAALVAEVHPADLAEIMDDLSEPATLALFQVLEPDVAGEVLDEAESEVAEFIFDELPDAQLAEILDELPVDDAARLLATLEDAQAEAIITLMSPEEAADVRDHLTYPDGTAGRLMNDNFVRLRGRWTVGEALEYLRHTDPDAEILTYLYVTDAEGVLTGVVPLRQLVMAQPDQTIAEIRETRVISVPVTALQEEVADVISKYDFVSIPVVDDRGQLVGVVAVDDIVDVIEEEATEDIQRFGGSEPLNNPYFSVTVPRMARKRMGWLLILFLGGTLTSTVIAAFEDELAAVLILAVFIPLLVDSGGNSGSQTVSTIIRALALGEVEWRDALRVLGREFATGLSVGSALGVVAFLVVRFIWQAPLDVTIVVALTMPVIITWSTIVASFIPLAAERLRIDPTVISAPFITTFVDATGLIIYFMIARAVLGL
jgi:magnesium transporter